MGVAAGLNMVCVPGCLQQHFLTFLKAHNDVTRAEELSGNQTKNSAALEITRGAVMVWESCRRFQRDNEIQELPGTDTRVWQYCGNTIKMTWSFTMMAPLDCSATGNPGSVPSWQYCTIVTQWSNCSMILYSEVIPLCNNTLMLCHTPIQYHLQAHGTGQWHSTTVWH